MGLEKLKVTKQKTINSDLNYYSGFKNIILLNNELQEIQKLLKQTDKEITEKNVEISNLEVNLMKL